MAADDSAPKWKTAKQAGAYIGKGPRFIHREIRAGRLKAAKIGGRGEALICDQWLDEYVEARATPIPFTPRKRA